MKLRYRHKHILYMVFISCIALLSINFISDGSYRTDHKTSRIIIKTTEKEYVPDIKENTENEGIRTLTPVINGKSEVQLLPIPDANSPIIVTPL